MKAIERIAGYACEVNEDQWRELVKVATELGMQHSCSHHSDCKIAQIESDGELVCLTDNYGEKLIPYRDFLAKLKGDEKWEPKNGDEVEIWCNMTTRWRRSKFIGVDSDKDIYVCLMYDNPSCSYTAHKRADVKPIQSITRAEAEKILGKRIVD